MPGVAPTEARAVRRAPAGRAADPRRRRHREDWVERPDRDDIRIEEQHPRLWELEGPELREGARQPGVEALRGEALPRALHRLRREVRALLDLCDL